MPDLLERPHDVPADSPATQARSQPGEQAENGREASDDQQGRQNLAHRTNLREAAAVLGTPLIATEAATHRHTLRFWCLDDTLSL